MDCYLTYLKGHSNEINCLSSSGSLLASGSSDGTIRVWDLKTQKSIRRLTDPHFFPTKPIENVALEDFLVLASSGDSIYAFDIRNPSCIILHNSLWTIGYPDDISQISLKKPFASVSLDNGDIVLINIETQDIITSLSLHSNVSFYLDRVRLCIYIKQFPRFRRF